MFLWQRFIWQISNTAHRQYLSSISKMTLTRLSLHYIWPQVVTRSAQYKVDISSITDNLAIPRSGSLQQIHDHVMYRAQILDVECDYTSIQNPWKGNIHDMLIVLLLCCCIAKHASFERENDRGYFFTDEAIGKRFSLATRSFVTTIGESQYFDIQFV